MIGYTCYTKDIVYSIYSIWYSPAGPLTCVWFPRGGLMRVVVFATVESNLICS